MAEKHINLVKTATNSYKIIIKNSLEDKIRFLCNKFPATEWSGILFWDIQGNFEKNNIVIEAKDFLLMDIGDSTTTAFEVTPKVISYMVDNGLVGSYTGLMHSHHSMAAFFSGTDTNTLLSEGQKSNHFVSLIVNNAGTYCAAITRLVKSEEEIKAKVTYKSFGDKEIKGKENYTTSSEYVEYFPLVVEWESARKIYTDIESDIAEIQEQKEEEKKKMSQSKWAMSEYGKIPTYNEPSLFNDSKYVNPFEDFTTFPTVKSFDEKNDIEEVPDIKDITEQFCNQLLKGSPFAEVSDLNLWAKINMVQKFKKRFPIEQSFTIFAENFIDALIEDFNLWEDNIILQEVVSTLKKLPSNMYIQTYINYLNKYINGI